MPRVKLQKPTEAERLASIAVDTRKIIRQAMILRDVPYIIDLAALIGMGNSTLSLKLKTGSWTQKDLCKLVTALRIPPEEAVRMLGVRPERKKADDLNEKDKATLSAQGMRVLKSLEAQFNTCLLDGHSDLAWDTRHQYVGAVRVLAALGLLTLEEGMSRSGVLLEQYMDTVRSSRSKEAV